MKHFFHPRSLRHHLSPEQRQRAKKVSILLLITGTIFAFMALNNTRVIAKNDLLTNEQLLTLRSEAKENREVLSKYQKLSFIMSENYVSARRNQTLYVSGAMLSLILGSLILKLRKNLAKK